MKKNITLFSTIALPIILFLATPYLNVLTKDKKELEYKISSVYSINNENSPISDWPNLVISYKDGDESRSIKNGSIIMVEIKNTGSIPIGTEDYEKPLTITSSEQNSILGFKVISKYPADLDITAEKVNNSLKINNTLLNPDEHFTFELLMAGNDIISSVHARIKGASIVKNDNQAKPGIVLSRIHYDNNNTPLYSTIFSFNPFVTLPIGFLLLMLTMHGMQKIITIDNGYILISILSISTEILGAAFIIPFIAYIQDQYQLSTFSSLTILSSISICALIAGYITAQPRTSPVEQT